MPGSGTDGLDALTSRDVRHWFQTAFPAGPTPAQERAWPAIARAEHLLLVAPTGTGKTLAAFLALIDRLWAEHQDGGLPPRLRCVYVSPLRSLGYDIERNLRQPIEALSRAGQGPPIRVAVRTGDTPNSQRRAQRLAPPHVLITTPESLALLLSQAEWHDHFATVDQVIIDELHALVPTKRGADLALSIERLAALADRGPVRVGLSATCGPPRPVARFLVGPSRECRIIEIAPGPDPPEVRIESLLRPDEAPHRGLTYRRLLRRLRSSIARERTTVIFASTRAFTERVAHDLKADDPPGTERVAAHHSALTAARRRAVEAELKAGRLRAVVTSTSLELGVDIGTADLSVLVGLPGSVARCLQRVGRAGHRVGAPTKGLLIAASAAELAGAAVTARAARESRVEEVRPVLAPLDVLCQQLVGMACAADCALDDAYLLVRRTAPFEALSRDDFDACLDFLAGQLPSPPGAFEPEPGAAPRWTASRLWKHRGWFGLRDGRVGRWYRMNVGTIHSEETVRVEVDGRVVGTVEAAYAERLLPGDRFLLDGRPRTVRRLDGLVLYADAAGDDPQLPRWTSDRQGLSRELALDLARFRERAALKLAEGPPALRAWLADDYGLDHRAVALLEDLFEAQEGTSEVPRAGMVLIEEAPDRDGWLYAFHVPLGRAACEALGRAIAARIGERFGRDLALAAADLGFTVRTADRLPPEAIPGLFDPDRFLPDVERGLDRGELIARRFRRVAATGLLVLKNHERSRPRVGGALWVSRRLYPLVRAACPDHPLIREARREAIEDVLDAPAALAWLNERPTPRLRCLDAVSPFTAAWLVPEGAEPITFEPPAAALRRLQQRLLAVSEAPETTQ